MKDSQTQKTQTQKTMQQQDETRPGGIGRRGFVALSVTAGLATAACSSADEVVEETGPMEVVETDVEITTPDGVSDAVFLHPATGSYPAVLIWTDAFGMRPTFREMGRRLAAEGFSVLVPNPYYRLAKGVVFPDPPSFNFQNPTDREKLTPLMGSITAAGAAERDATAFVAWLDAQPQVDTTKKIGTQGYCMGGPLIVRTAAALPNRVGAAASFHGGGLVNDTPESPHLLAPKIMAKMYFGIAANDDAQQPDAKDKLREAFGDKAEVELYSESQHGWCIMDMPLQDNGDPIYNMPDAERAWSKLLELYKSQLV